MPSAETDRDTGMVGQDLPESLLAMISEIPWSASLDGNLSWIHPAAKNLYGYSAAELLSSPQLRWDAIHVDDRQRVLEQWDTLAGQASPWSTEYRIIDPIRTCIVSMSWCSLILEMDEGPQVHGLTRIITDRRNLETALRDAEAVYLSLVESLPLSVLEKGCARAHSICQCPGLRTDWQTGRGADRQD